MSFPRARIIGCGSFLPSQRLTNADLSERLDTSDEWIVTRTGIRQRHVAAEGEFTSHLALKAAERALADAGIAAEDLDLIVLATSTPDDTFPATATRVQAGLGAARAAAFDVQAVCSGFVYALAVADNFVRAGRTDTALVIGAETFSRILDWNDRGTCVLFGDGAGAVVLRRTTDEETANAVGILSTHLHTDGRFRDILYVDGGPSTTKTAGCLRMSGKEVYRHAVTHLSAVAEEALAANHRGIADLDWVIPHQANTRILDGVARKLGLPREKMISTVDHHANTSAASIPLALDEAIRDGRVRPGQLILLEAIGGGLTWGAALVRL